MYFVFVFFIAAKEVNDWLGPSACVQDYTQTSGQIVVKHGGEVGNEPRKDPFIFLG